MLSFKQFINEYLTPAQTRKVDSWIPYNPSGSMMSPKAEEISKHVIPDGQHAVTIPIIPHVMNAVHEHLNKHGYTDHNYVKGTTVDKFGRVQSIGKALEKTKADDELKNDYANDNKKFAVNAHKYDGLMSAHPYHIAEGSTNKPWRSCNTLTPSGRCTSYGNGVAAKKIPEEIKHGTHVVYVVPKLKSSESSEMNFPNIQQRIDNAVARVYLKPHETKGGDHTVLEPEDKVYEKKPTGKNLSLLKTLRNFTDQNYPKRDGKLYYKNRYVYDDDASGNTPKFNINDKSIDLLKNDENYQVREQLLKSPKLNSSQIDKLIDTTDPSNLGDIVHNKNLKKSHFKKLFNINHPSINYNLSMSDKLPGEFKDELHKRIIDEGDLQKSMMLPRSNNMSSENLHHLINKTIQMYDRHDKRYNSIPFGINHVTQSILASKTPITQEHIDKLYNSGNKGILAQNRLLSNEQLEQALKLHQQDFNNSPDNSNTNETRYMMSKRDHPYNKIKSELEWNKENAVI